MSSDSEQTERETVRLEGRAIIDPGERSYPGAGSDEADRAVAERAREARRECGHPSYCRGTCRALEERAAIVAWLRAKADEYEEGCESPSLYYGIREHADMLERGEHVPR